MPGLIDAHTCNHFAMPGKKVECGIVHRLNDGSIKYSGIAIVQNDSLEPIPPHTKCNVKCVEGEYVIPANK